MPAEILLYDYWRSSAAYRVRITLNLKKLPYEQRAVHLVRDGGEQKKATYAALNPQQLVPTLVDGTQVFTQSMAIIEYLDEKYPRVPLLPDEPARRAQCRALAQIIACDLHPLNNLRVLQYLTATVGTEESQKTNWYRHWLYQGLNAFEALLVRYGQTQEYCLGMQPTLADCCLLPQIYNAQRFDCDLSAYPLICQVSQACSQDAAFVKAHPDNQPDANS